MTTVSDYGSLCSKSECFEIDFWGWVDLLGVNYKSRGYMGGGGGVDNGVIVSLEGLIGMATPSYIFFFLSQINSYFAGMSCQPMLCSCDI